MALGWKFLIPVSIVWLLLVATVRAWRLDSSSKVPYVVLGIVLVLIVGLLTMWESAAQQRAARYAAAEEADRGGSRHHRARRPVSRCRRLTCRTTTVSASTTQTSSKEVTGA